jgi:hypothetical protein
MRFASARAVMVCCALLGAIVALVACEPPPVPATIGPGANPNPPVPPPQQEARPLPPVSEEPLVWRIGAWEWVGTGYVWRPGEWEPLGTHSNQYLPGHWTVQDGTWAWERGHWL